MGKTVNYCICCGSVDLSSNPALWMPFVSDRAMGLAPMVISENTHLRSIKNGTAYALCKSLYCNNCGHLFVNYRFDESEMASLYKDYRGIDYCSLREHYEQGYAAQNASLAHGDSYRDSVEGFLDGVITNSELCVLDWGGDTGKNTPYLDKSDTVHIYEPSGIRPKVANATNVSEPRDFLSSYGLIVLSNVLEHIPWPAETLNSVVKYMSASSILFIEVPYESLQVNAESLGPDAGPPIKLHWHEHINFFSKASLAALLQASNLNIVKSEALDVDRGDTGVSSSKALRIACELKSD